MSEPTNPTEQITAEAPKPGGETGVTPARPAGPAKPAAPPKPAVAKKPERRFFLVSFFAAGMTAMTLALIGMLLGTIRFLFPNVLSEPPSRFKVGFPDQFEEGKVVDRFKDQGTWIVRYRDDKYGEIIYALSTTCTHLGCTPNWLEREAKFKCPCHGSGFKITGVNFEGPAPRPLERWGIAIAEDGQVVVDKSKKFQKELGQWDNPDSFIKVV
jgi:cytochrome b6-f complex iron-sulfur subunit